jgi:hypothetical protein
MTSTETPAETPEQPLLRIPRSAHPTPTPTTHGSRPIPVLAYAGALLAVIAVIVVGTQAQGWFGTSGQMGAQTSTGAGAEAGGGERLVPEAGASTAEIKGWMSLQQVIDAYPVAQAALFTHFAIPAGTSMGTTLSELKEGGTSTLDVPTLRSWIDDGAPSAP